MTSWCSHRFGPMVLCCSMLAAAACTPEAAHIRSLKEVTLVSYNRLYPAFAETTTVAPGVRFPIGDGEMAARVQGYLPDFQMDTLGRAESRSDRPDNPAVRLEILEGRMRRYYAWAFLKAGSPHFRARDQIALNIVALTLSDGTRITAAERAQP